MDSKIVGGALKLKGGISLLSKKDKKKKHKTEKKAKKKRSHDEMEGKEGGEEVEEYVPTLLQGSGDAIIVQHPSTYQDETRIVVMVLSDISISVSSPFSTDLITATKFQYIKKPKEAFSAEAEEGHKKAKRAEIEKGAYGEYSDSLGSTVTYRVRNPGAAGTYKLVTKKVDGATMSRQQLLDERVKMKGDRHCY